MESRRESKKRGLAKVKKQEKMRGRGHFNCEEYNWIGVQRTEKSCKTRRKNDKGRKKKVFSSQCG